jgi:hypothetical protein
MTAIIIASWLGKRTLPIIRTKSSTMRGKNAMGADGRALWSLPASYIVGSMPSG